VVGRNLCFEGNFCLYIHVWLPWIPHPSYRVCVPQSSFMLVATVFKTTHLYMITRSALSCSTHAM